MVRKIPIETNSFQAVLLPLQPASFPHQIEDRTCWQIGCATNCHKQRETETEKSGIDCFYLTCLWLASVSNSSYLLLVVFDCKPQARQAGDSFLKGLFIQGILSFISTAVQNSGYLALVATHAQQLHGKLLTDLLQAQVLRLLEKLTISHEATETPVMNSEQG